MLIVAALGGNALRRPGEPLEAGAAERNVRSAVRALAEIAADHDLVVVHGNGPQIGLLALQGEACRDARAYPLDVLGAESPGMIGYLLERELAGALPGRHVVSLLTQTVVDVLDPAFRKPTVPIGPVYDAADARRLANERGWSVAPGDGGWHRVVASPVPRSIVELPTIELLLGNGAVVVCAGGGGVPIVLDSDSVRHGVEAVVDKDAATALLARHLGADLLLLLTDVPAVELDFGTTHPRPLGAITTHELLNHEFAPGSMAPKVAAAATFATVTGRRAAIGSLEDATALVDGSAGTQVRATEAQGAVRA